jgi:hypothetical protein
VLDVFDEKHTRLSERESGREGEGKGKGERGGREGRGRCVCVVGLAKGAYGKT